MSKQRYRVLLIAWTLFAIVSAVGPNSKVIYGEDTRRDFYELSAKEKSFGVSTVAILIGEQVLTQQEDYTWLITPTKSAQELWGWCPTERFASQPVASSAVVFCSGFLISSSPSWIVTAAHCTERPLDQYWVVFNFHQVSASNTELRFSPEDVYWVKSLVAAGEPTAGAGDWGVLELDRDVVGHVPYSQIRADITVGETLVLVGHPYGLPKKTDTDGEVKNVSLTEIRGFVDSYGGNSGSPIFDSKGALVGILVGGAPDFTVNEGCEISNVCPGGQGCSSLGEHIVPICVLADDPNIAPLGLCDQIKLVFQGNSASGNPVTIIHALLILLGVVLLV